ncbi:uncharacterized protein BDV14DRAFT_82632 [Aspergillus stella-maris]|uniref:uncharacterized protein n=1 Tax=Aspergillus stella-maris TaxID=1810926 RepID=UPI003CCDA486
MFDRASCMTSGRHSLNSRQTLSLFQPCSEHIDRPRHPWKIGSIALSLLPLLYPGPYNQLNISIDSLFTMDYNYYLNVPFQGNAQEASSENQTIPGDSALRYSWSSLESGSPGSFPLTGYESGASSNCNYSVPDVSDPAGNYVSLYSSNPIRRDDSVFDFGPPEMPDLPEGLEYAPSAPTNIASPGPYIGQSVQQGDLSQEISPAGRERYYCGWKACTASFKQKDDHARHVKALHFGRQGHAYPLCKRVFNRKDNLWSHIRTAHNSQVQNFPLATSDRDTLSIEWELPSIVYSIPENERPGFLLNSITLTMGENGVSVMICKQFIEAQYGPDGIKLVNCLLCTIASNDRRYVNDHFIIDCMWHSVCVSFEPGKLPGNLRGLLVWLCLTFRQPKQDAVCLSTCKVGGQSATLQKLSVVPTDNRGCWFSLFKTAVIAMEPHLQTIAPALEIDFLLLLQLAGVEYPVLVDGGLVLMGYSTALIPTKRVDDKTILWHLETSHRDF